MRFPVVLHTDDGIRYGVTVPDLPGCFSAGDNFDAAIESVREAIDLHLEGMAEDGEEIPVPRSFAEHRAKQEYAEGIWVAVEVDVTSHEGHDEHIDLTLPHRLLAKIDEYAHRHGTTRSQFLADAARRAMS